MILLFSLCQSLVSLLVDFPELELAEDVEVGVLYFSISDSLKYVVIIFPLLFSEIL